MSKEKANSSISSSRAKGVNYLLLIAIDKYDYWPELRNCVRGAKDIRDTLLANYQFEKEFVREYYDKDVTRENIFAEFDWLRENLMPNDNLIFYFSGHGKLIQEKNIEESYWIMADSKVISRHSDLSDSEIKKNLKALDVHHLFGFVDSCFSGAMFKGERASIKSKNSLYLSKSRYLLTAGRLNVVEAGPPKGYSPFVSSILSAFNDNIEDLNSEKFWVTKLGDEVIDNLYYQSRHLPRIDPLFDLGHDGGRFAFYKKGVKVPKRKFRKGDTTQVGETTQKAVTTQIQTRRSLGIMGLLILLLLIILKGVIDVDSPDGPEVFSKSIIKVSDTLNFGDVELGSFKKDTCMIRNDGDTTLIITRIDTPSWMTVVDSPRQILKGDSALMIFLISTKSLIKESYNDFITIHSNDKLSDNKIPYSLKIIAKPDPIRELDPDVVNDNSKVSEPETIAVMGVIECNRNELKNIPIKIPEFDWKDTTDENGEFKLSVPRENLPKSTRLKFGNKVITITIEEDMPLIRLTYSPYVVKGEIINDANSKKPLENILVTLEDGRTTTTDSIGKFAFKVCEERPFKISYSKEDTIYGSVEVPVRESGDKNYWHLILHKN